MTLYFTELAVADVPAAVAWYTAVGLAVERADPANGFVLLSAPGGGRLAVKAGVPVPGGVTLHFQVADLDAALARLAGLGVVPTGPVKASAEGYCRVVFADPDGHRVTLFAWAGPQFG